MKPQELLLSVPGKFVLAGEHSVLRGGRAVAAPHPTFALEVWRGEVEKEWAQLSDETRLLLRLMQREGESTKFCVKNSIPTGAGLGSSAAICVAAVRLTLPGASDDVLISRARELENEFHGQSSGMDVAAVACGEPILFEKGKSPIPLSQAHRGVKLPRIQFFDTGLRASTKECIQKVALLEPNLAEALDQKMAQAVDLLLSGRAPESFNLAQECYEGWGLVPDSVRNLRLRLLEQGFRGVKLTGAGGGGFLIAV